MDRAQSSGNQLKPNRENLINFSNQPKIIRGAIINKIMKIDLISMMKVFH